MRQLSLLALAIAIALTAGLVAVFGGQRLAVETDEPPRFVMAVVENSTTSTFAMVLNVTVGIDHAEMESLEAVIEETTTTTTTAPTTTTTEAAPQPKPKPKPAPPVTTTTVPKAPTTTAPAPAGAFNSSFEADFYNRINSLRSGNGLAPLSRSGQLDSYARAWAKHMGDTGVFAHSNYPTQLVNAGWSSAGESVGKGGSVNSIFDALKSSSGHRSIMLGAFTHVGVGAWVDSKGTIWTAHLFAQS